MDKPAIKPKSQARKSRTLNREPVAEETMTEQEANELVFGDFADELEIYGLTDIGNK